MFFPIPHHLIAMGALRRSFAKFDGLRNDLKDPEPLMRLETKVAWP